MRPTMSRSRLALAALLTHACALTGYDFDDYERATMNGDQREGDGGDGDSAGDESAGDDSETGGAGTEPAGPLVASIFGVGGDDSARAGAANNGSANDGIGGADAAAGQNTGGDRACRPRDCFEQGLPCGLADDACGRPLDCGACFWWFQECRPNRCEIPE
jgi:hypothetical protein